MSDLLARASSDFAARGWPSAPVDEPRAVEVRHGWSASPFRSYAQDKLDGAIFVYYSLVPERAPPERREAVLRYLARVNFSLLVGAFEMDLDDGEVRLRTSIDLHGAAMTDELMGGVVYPNHQAMIDYLRGLLSVIRGDQGPDEAFDEAVESRG